MKRPAILALSIVMMIYSCAPSISRQFISKHPPLNYTEEVIVLGVQDAAPADAVICRVKNKFKTAITVTEEGKLTLWAKTESKTDLSINVEFGNEYYIRCGVSMGFFVGHPTPELVDSKTGKLEYESFKAKKR
nr:hypothetical protein [Bacteroidota bacterium]